LAADHVAATLGRQSEREAISDVRDLGRRERSGFGDQLGELLARQLRKSAPSDK
jgi:hypothetical protein